MKTSYSKRVLAFWLAVAMLATGAPMALALEPDTTQPVVWAGTPGEGGEGGGITPLSAEDIKKVTITQSEVTVDGIISPQDDIKVKAFSDEDGKSEITENLVWEIVATEGGDASHVTVGADGGVTVNAKAKAGTYTITPKINNEAASESAILIVKRLEEQQQQVFKVIVSGGQSKLTIPESGSATTQAFTVKFLNAFDEPVTQEKVVKWNVIPAKPENADKVTIDKGVVTVQAGAVEDTVTVTADIEGSTPGIGEKATLTLEKAASRLVSVEDIWMSGTNGEKIEVTDGLTLRVDEEAILSVTGKDQYDVSMDAEITNITSTSDKLTIDAGNKKITAKEPTGDTPATVVITVKDIANPITLPVIVEPQETTGYTVEFVAKPESKRYGDLITEPTVKVTDDKQQEVTVNPGEVRFEYRKVDKTGVSTLNALTTMPKDVGTYQVVAYYNSKDGKSASSDPVEFEITKRPITVTIDNKSITYGDAIPALTYQLAEGTTLASWDTESAVIVLTTDAKQGSAAGTYKITPTLKSENYEVTYKNANSQGVLTINRLNRLDFGVSKISSSKNENSGEYTYSTSSGSSSFRIDVDGKDDMVSFRPHSGASSAYWIGFNLTVKDNGTVCKPSDLYYRTSSNGSWTKLKDDIDAGYFHIDFNTSSMDVWFDTDGDTDNQDNIYFATSASGANAVELIVDFDADGGSSSSSGSTSSSSSTSKKDGDRVSTTTVDRTPTVKSGSASTTFSTSTLENALSANKREARREDADKTFIELDVKSSKTVDDTTVTMPRKMLDTIADEDTGIQLTTNHGTITFDYRALSQIYNASSKTNVEFYVEEDDDQYTLLIRDGSNDVIDLGSGEAEITFEYKLKSGEKSSDVKVYRVGDGNRTWLASYGGSTVYGGTGAYAATTTYVTDMKASYSSSKKQATFTTDELGTFLVTTDTLTTGSSGTTTTPTYPTYPTTPTFVDVPSSRWSATYINKLAALGIINGTGGGYFEPTVYVTREEFVKMLAGVAGANVSGYTSSRFPDVSLSRWSAPYIAWAADRGITTGTDGGRFAPTMRITREEMATMIYRYVQSAGKTLPSRNAPATFADASSIDNWALTAVSVMQQAGIIDGNVNNGRYTFDPFIPATREECAKMLAILYDLT